MRSTLFLALALTITCTGAFGLTLTVQAAGLGTTNPIPGDYTYAPGDTVTVTAVPDTGRSLYAWYINGEEDISDLTLSFEITEDTVIDARFAYNLTLGLVGEGTFGVTPGTYPVPAGETLELTATPTGEGYFFSHWVVQGMEFDINPLEFEMDEDAELTAVFEQGHLLEVNTVGGGTVDVSTGYQVQGSTVVLTATPTGSHTFVSWYLDGNLVEDEAGPLSVLMDEPHQVDAVFTSTITIQIFGSGHLESGRGEGAFEYASGTLFSDRAIGDNGQVFSRWVVNSVDKDTNPLAQLISGDTAIDVYFLQGYHLAVQKLGPGTMDPVEGTYEYESGTATSVIATPAADHKIIMTALDGVPNNIDPASPDPFTQPITMDDDHTFLAVFGWNFVIAKMGEGQITPNAGTHLAYPGAPATLKAKETTPGWIFDHWLINGVEYTTAEVVVTPDEDITALAVFANKYKIDIDVVGPGSTNPAPGRHLEDPDSTFSVTPVPTTPHVFRYWKINGEGAFTVQPLEFQVEENTAITAVFSYTLDVSVDGEGAVSGAPIGATETEPGTEVLLTQQADDGWQFSHWFVNNTMSVTSPTFSTTMDDNVTVVAHFIKKPILTINVTGQGDTEPGAGPHVYDLNADASVVATPEANHEFRRWIVDGVPSEDEPLELMMDEDRTVEAVFTSWLVTSGVEGTGTLNPPAGQIACEDGEQKTFSATAGANARFSHWLVDGESAGTEESVIVSVTGNTTVTAVFIDTFALAVSVLPSNSGTVAISPEPGPYDDGTDVTLTPTPASGYVFDRWDGDATGSDDPLVVSMSAAKSIIAVFKPLYDLQVTAEPVAGGTFDVDHALQDIPENTQVTVTPQPAVGYAFDHWAGDASGSDDPLIVTMNENKNIVGVFVPTHTVTAVANPAGGGTVAVLPDLDAYKEGVSITVTAQPAAGYAFTGWAGAYAGQPNPATLEVNDDVTITANFVPIYELTIDITGSGQVDANPKPGPYVDNTIVTLTPTPGANFAFDHWEGALQGNANPATILMNGAKQVTAVFVAVTRTLTTSVQPANAGTVVPDSQPPYVVNSTVTLTAQANPGFEFDHWEGAAAGTVNPVSVAMSENREVTAVFVPLYTFAAVASPLAGGQVAVTPQQDTYKAGTPVSVQAAPQPGYVFSHWTGDATGSANPLLTSVNKNSSVTAVFVQPQYALTATPDPAQGGSIAMNPPGGAYNALTEVTVTATPDAANGYVFSHWSGDLQGAANPAKIVMTGAKNISAVFTKQQVALTTQVTPSGAGTVTANPLTATYEWGTEVTLSAAPATGYVFSRWELDAAGTAPTTKMTMNGAKSARAVFVKQTFNLVTTVEPTSSGSITLDPAEGPYEYGASVTATAVPAMGYNFDHWEDAAGGSDTETSFVMNSGKTLRAVFVPKQYAVTVHVTPSGAGMVTRDPNTATYAYGSTVTLTATPAAGFQFLRWEDDATGANGVNTVSVNGAKNIVAVFGPVTYTLTTNVSPEGAGTITPVPDDGPYENGTQVTVTATAAEGAEFDHWEGALTGSTNPAVVSMNMDKTLTARFKPIGCALTAIASVLPADGSTVYVTPGNDNLALVMTAATDCLNDTQIVHFTLDDAFYAGSETPDSEGLFSASSPKVQDLGYGTHSLRVATTSKFFPDVVIEKTITFSIVSAPASLDEDGNGLPDDPFEALVGCGSYWYSAATSEQTGNTSISAMVRFAGDCGKAGSSEPVAITIENPDNPAQTITVTAPDGLLYEGEDAVLIVKAAADLITLYGPVEASIFGVEPGAFIGGGQYIEVTLLTSFAGSGVYSKMTADRLADNPLRFTMSGLEFTPGGNPALYSHATQVQQNPITGLEIVAWESDWVADHVTGLLAAEGRLEGNLVGLSTFAPFELTLDAPAMATTPSAQYPYSFGNVEVDKSKDATFTITNTARDGGGRLIGEAKTSGAFSFVSAQSYDLGPGESADIVVRFAPTAKQRYLGNLVLTGGGGATIQLSGTGFASDEPPVSCIGATASATGGGFRNGRGDLLLVAVVLMALAAVGARPARQAVRR